MTSKSIPVRIKLLDTCTSQYFQGFGGPTVAVPVDCRTTASQLFDAIFNDDGAWPHGLTDAGIRWSISQAIGVSALTHNTYLFPDVYPEERPPVIPGVEDIFVVQIPDEERWLVIEGINEEVVATCSTYGEAMWATWEHSEREWQGETVYAYFGIELDLPEGYEVYHETTEHGVFWVWDKNEPCNPGYDTEMDAKVAAWRDYLDAQEQEPTPRQRALAAEFTPGPTDRRGSDCYPYATINHRTNDADDGIWWSRIDVYGTDEANAKALRDRIINALSVPTVGTDPYKEAAARIHLDRIHRILDGDPNQPGIEWDSETVDEVAEVIRKAGYTIRDAGEE